MADNSNALVVVSGYTLRTRKYQVILSAVTGIQITYQDRNVFLLYRRAQLYHFVDFLFPAYCVKKGRVHRDVIQTMADRAFRDHEVSAGSVLQADLAFIGGGDNWQDQGKAR